MHQPPEAIIWFVTHPRGHGGLAVQFPESDPYSTSVFPHEKEMAERAFCHFDIAYEGGGSLADYLIPREAVVKPTQLRLDYAIGLLVDRDKAINLCNTLHQMTVEGSKLPLSYLNVGESENCSARMFSIVADKTGIEFQDAFNRHGPLALRRPGMVNRTVQHLTDDNEPIIHDPISGFTLWQIEERLTSPACWAVKANTEHPSKSIEFFIMCAQNDYGYTLFDEQPEVKYIPDRPHYKTGKRVTKEIPIITEEDIRAETNQRQDDIAI